MHRIAKKTVVVLVITLISVCGGYAGNIVGVAEANNMILGNVERQIVQGTIIGQYYSHNGYEAQRYLGIPYAKAPVGNLRFRPPQDPGPFPGGRLEACKYGSMCPQLVLGQLSGKEDCLYLNVWTPKDAKPGDLYPVMFFIHGGSNMFGSGNQALGDFIGMAEQATSLNSYNSFFAFLGAFTSLDEPIGQGNYLASQHNVILVTINYRLGRLGHLAHPAVGEGSGNFAFLDMLKALQWVNGNIGNFGGDKNNVTVFGESSGAWDTCALMNMPAAKGLFHKAIMESQSCLSRTIAQSEVYGYQYVQDSGCAASADVAQCLRDADVTAFVKSDQILFLPAVDGKVMPRHFAEAIATDQFNHVPIIIGNNKEELVLDLLTDIGFNCPLDANLAIFAKYLRKPVYQYRFEHHPVTDSIPVVHMLELPYVFGSTKDIFGSSEVRETAVEKVVGAYWTNFARTGNPNGGWQVYWPSYNRVTQLYLRLKAWPCVGWGSIITNPANTSLSRTLIETSTGAQIVFW